jgi:hypothetical protein
MLSSGFIFASPSIGYRSPNAGLPGSKSFKIPAFQDFTMFSLNSH